MLIRITVFIISLCIFSMVFSMILLFVLIPHTEFDKVSFALEIYLAGYLVMIILPHSIWLRKILAKYYSVKRSTDSHFVGRITDREK